jgi:hypothetical protein
MLEKEAETCRTTICLCIIVAIYFALVGIYIYIYSATKHAFSEYFFPQKRAVYKIMWENMEKPDKS